MMHTYQGKETRFHYNLDFSGKVRILNWKSGVEMEVLAEDVAEFVVKVFVKRRLAQVLESMNLMAVLKGSK